MRALRKVGQASSLMEHLGDSADVAVHAIPALSGIEAERAQIMVQWEAASEVVGTIEAQRAEAHAQLNTLLNRFGSLFVGHLNHSELVSTCQVPEMEDEPVLPAPADSVDYQDSFAAGSASDILERLQRAALASEGVEVAIAELEAQQEQAMKEWSVLEARTVHVTEGWGAASERVERVKAEQDEVKGQLQALVEGFNAAITVPLLRAQQLAEDLCARETAAPGAGSQRTHTDPRAITSPAPAGKFLAGSSALAAAAAARKRKQSPLM